MKMKQDKQPLRQRQQRAKRHALSLLIVGTLALSGCATHTELTAPCPNFGKHCAQIPINHWHYPPPD